MDMDRVKEEIRSGSAIFPLTIPLLVADLLNVSERVEIVIMECSEDSRMLPDYKAIVDAIRAVIDLHNARFPSC
jgi:hypothetical protein